MTDSSLVDEQVRCEDRVTVMKGQLALHGVRKALGTIAGTRLPRTRVRDKVL